MRRRERRESPDRRPLLTPLAQAARARRNQQVGTRSTIPKSGDLNSMLAWAIENSDPSKLKQAAEQAQRHVVSRERK